MLYYRISSSYIIVHSLKARKSEGSVLIVSLVMLLGQSGEAFACSCAYEHPLDRLEKNDAVFTGTVTDLAYLGEKDM